MNDGCHRPVIASHRYGGAAHPKTQARCICLTPAGFWLPLNHLSWLCDLFRLPLIVFLQTNLRVIRLTSEETSY